MKLVFIEVITFSYGRCFSHGLCSASAGHCDRGDDDVCAAKMPP